MHAYTHTGMQAERRYYKHLNSVHPALNACNLHKVLYVYWKYPVRTYHSILAKAIAHRPSSACTLSFTLTGSCISLQVVISQADQARAHRILSCVTGWVELDAHTGVLHTQRSQNTNIQHTQHTYTHTNNIHICRYPLISTPQA